MSGLGPAGPAVGVGRHLVGQHADRAGGDALPVVGATGHDAGAGLEGAEGAVVGAEVEVLSQAHPEQRAVLLGGNFHVVVLTPPGVCVLHALGAGLDPLDRPAEQA